MQLHPLYTLSVLLQREFSEAAVGLSLSASLCFLSVKIFTRVRCSMQNLFGSKSDHL